MQHWTPTEPEPVTALHPHPAALSQSFLHRLSGMRSSSAGVRNFCPRACETVLTS